MMSLRDGFPYPELRNCFGSSRDNGIMFLDLILNFNYRLMNEIDEIILGKNNDQLIIELNFQLKQGESLGGTICSEILGNIKGELWFDESNNIVTNKKNTLFRKIN